MYYNLKDLTDKNLKSFSEMLSEILEPEPKIKSLRESFKKELELPGVKKEEVKISYNNEYLKITIMNDRFNKSRFDSKYLNYYIPEKFYNIDETKCTMVDGLLTVEIPLLKPEVKERNITIN